MQTMQGPIWKHTLIRSVETLHGLTAGLHRLPSYWSVPTIHRLHFIHWLILGSWSVPTNQQPPSGPQHSLLMKFIIYMLFSVPQLAHKKKKQSLTSSSSESSTDTDEDDQPPRSRKKKKFNVDKVIQSVVKDKARDKMLSRQIKDLIHGVDASSSSKKSFGYWISTLMPHISNKRFLQYAVNIMHHTIHEVNASEAEAELEATRPRSASAPPPVVRPSPPSQSHDVPLNLTTPPRKKPKQSQPSSLYGGASTSRQNPTQPQGNLYPQGQPGDRMYSNSSSSVDPNLDVFQTPQRPAPTSHGMIPSQGQQHPSSHAAVYGPNRQLQPSNLVPGMVAPQFLSGASGCSSGSNTTLDPSGKVYADLQPVQLSSVELLTPPSWQTAGPAPPSAVPQVSPTATMEANLEILGQHIQQTTRRLVRVKTEPPPSQETSEVDAENDEDVDLEEDDVESSCN